MRGLPRPPDDVQRVTFNVETDGARSSTSFWLLAPGSGGAVESDLLLELGDLIFAAFDLFNPIVSSATTITTCRLVTFSPTFSDLQVNAAPNAGLRHGAQAANVAAGIAWSTGDRGRGNTPITRLPGFTDELTDDHLTLNANAYGFMQPAIGNFIDAVNAISRGTVASVTLGTLRRVSSGTPLHAAVFAPYFFGRPVKKIARVDARLYLSS